VPGWLPEPILTPRLVLRSSTASDIPLLTALRTDGAVRAFLGGPMNPERARERAEAELGTVNRFIVTCQEDGSGIGVVALSDEGHGGLEVSYAFLPTAWGVGYAVEAVRAVLVWAFEVRGIEELLVVTQTANARSRRLIERLAAVSADEFEEFGAQQTVCRLRPG